MAAVYGPKNGRWNPDRLISSQGYVLVRVGKEHPLANVEGYAYEHLVVWAAAGRPLPQKHQLLHHVDEVRSHNALSNLELKTRVAHGRHHIVQRKRDERGRLVASA